ncbi:hypothetical protein Dda_0673 [Drechslerella dactyloides]|uniref:Uncharacterized protein n=1 Tax=Drechslerella dactyloides TaxID=74499 RepID=A0AAD6J833_DREDA|nr:hypothetical protein Dda_0673 [Drechslerella dactyloides]
MTAFHISQPAVGNFPAGSVAATTEVTMRPYLGPDDVRRDIYAIDPSETTCTAFGGSPIWLLDQLPSEYEFQSRFRLRAPATDLGGMPGEEFMTESLTPTDRFTYFQYSKQYIGKETWDRWVPSELFLTRDDGDLGGLPEDIGPDNPIQPGDYLTPDGPSWFGEISVTPNAFDRAPGAFGTNPGDPTEYILGITPSAQDIAFMSSRSIVRLQIGTILDPLPAPRLSGTPTQNQPQPIISPVVDPNNPRPSPNALPPGRQEIDLSAFPEFAPRIYYNPRSRSGVSFIPEFGFGQISPEDDPFAEFDSPLMENIRPRARANGGMADNYEEHKEEIPMLPALPYAWQRQNMPWYQLPADSDDDELDQPPSRENGARRSLEAAMRAPDFLPMVNYAIGNAPGGVNPGLQSQVMVEQESEASVHDGDTDDLDTYYSSESDRGVDEDETRATANELPGTVAGLAAYAAGVSGLILDAVQVPSPTFTGTLPDLRVCRPAPGENPTVVNPLQTSCPIDPATGRDIAWQWNYASTPSVEGKTLLNLYGPRSASGEVPMLLNEGAYNTRFTYGYTNPGLPRQPSEFRVIRNGQYQAIDVNNKLQKGDTLEFYGPTNANAPDKNLRLNRPPRQPQTWILSRQIAGANGQPTNIGVLPTVYLRVGDLGNTEVVAPRQSWLQRGVNWLANTANRAADLGAQAIEGIGNAGTAAQTWAARTAAEYNRNPGQAFDNAIMTVARPLAAAGDRVGTAASNLYDTVVGVPGQLGQKVSQDLSGVSAAVSDGLLAVSEAVNNGVISAQEGYDRLRQGITQAASQGWEQAKQKLSSGWSGLKNLFSGGSNASPSVAGQTQPVVNTVNNAGVPPAVVADANGGQTVLDPYANPNVNVMPDNNAAGNQASLNVQSPLEGTPESSLEDVSVISTDGGSAMDIEEDFYVVDADGDGLSDVSIIEAPADPYDGAPATGWGQDSGLLNILDNMSSSQLIAGQAK